MEAAAKVVRELDEGCFLMSNGLYVLNSMLHDNYIFYKHEFNLIYCLYILKYIEIFFNISDFFCLNFGRSVLKYNEIFFSISVFFVLTLVIPGMF